ITVLCQSFETAAIMHCAKLLQDKGTRPTFLHEKGMYHAKHPRLLRHHIGNCRACHGSAPDRLADRRVCRNSRNSVAWTGTFPANEADPDASEGREERHARLE